MTEKLTLQCTRFHNESLSNYLIGNSKNILSSCKKILNNDGYFGEKLCDDIITPNMSSVDLQNEIELFHILKTITEMNSEYYFITPIPILIWKVNMVNK